MKTIRFILSNLDHYRTRFYITVLAGIMAGVSSFFIPLSLAEFTKQPLTAQNVTRLIIIISLLYLFSVMVAYIVRGKGEAMAFNYANYIRLKYFRKLHGLNASQLQKVHSGYTLSIINKVGDSMGELLFPVFWTMVPGLFVAALFFGFMIRESLLLGLVNIVIFSLFIGIGLALSRRMVPLAAELNKRRASLLETYVDFMANIITVKKLGIQSYANERITKRTDATAAQIDRLQRFHARRWFLLHTLFGIAYVGTLGFIIWQISHGEASPAVLILFVAAYGTVRSLIESLTENIKSFMQMRAYIEQLEAITTPETLHHGTHMPREWQAISFNDVHFAYNDGAPITIPEFQLTASQKVAVVGKSGQGKSTLINLFMNSLQPQAGSRLIGNTSYDDTKPEFFERNIALVSQDTELFNLSIRDNLTLGRSITDATLTAHLEAVALGPWLERLELGLDTVVGEKGVKLSAGQKQRLSILRAVLMDRPIMVLDEPTSHLDAQTEKTVIEFLAKYLAEKSAVIVTHRPALQSLTNATYILKEHTLKIS